MRQILRIITSIKISTTDVAVACVVVLAVVQVLDELWRALVSAGW